jgi:soluble lytic murein transglycosylase-like protein
MKTTNLLNVIFFVLITLIIVSSYEVICGDTKDNEDEDVIELGLNKGLVTSPTSLKMYELIEKYSNKYQIPKHIAYNVAYKETRYRGPFHWNYNPSQVSCVGALGPMQIMPGTAKLVQKRYVPNDVLKNDLNVNTEISMKLLNMLFKKYKDWSIACGCYNTGRPIVNGYALFCVNTKNYRKNWIYI